MNKQPIYLDNAAATPVDPDVLAAMQPYFSDKFYNPSATYLAAKAVRTDIGEARQQVARCIGAKPSEVIFTAGGSEANNLAIHGVMAQHPDKKILVSSIEHESVRQAAEGFGAQEIPVDSAGLVDLVALENLLDDDTVLVSVMYANNEIGTIQPLREIATLLQKVRTVRQSAGNSTPLLLHTDACQAANYLDLHVAKLGIDLMTLNGGKIYGPKQSGALYVKTGVALQPLVQGGGQERGLRSGTENVPAIVGFAAALEAAQSRRADETKRLTDLRDDFIQQLTTNFQGAVINGSRKKRLPNNISVTFPDTDNERLMMELDEAGIICAVGSACSASSDEPSHVLGAIGLIDAEAQATLRFTLGRGTTKADLDTVISKLKELLNG